MDDFKASSQKGQELIQALSSDSRAPLSWVVLRPRVEFTLFFSQFGMLLLSLIDGKTLIIMEILVT